MPGNTEDRRSGYCLCHAAALGEEVQRDCQLKLAYRYGVAEVTAPASM